jgi:N-methylhydantoinase B
MGVVLQKSSYSPNIRERLDASCGLFGKSKNMLAQAEHIPVHLGSMHIPLHHIDSELSPGDQIIINDPSMGGTHLPDITFYKPVFHDSKLIAYTGNRAHHADIGGITPGSIPANSNELFQEGLIIPPVKIMKNNKIDRDILALILANTRTPYERRGDLLAQLGANNHGEGKLIEFINSYGLKKFYGLEEEILNRTKIMLNKRLKKLPKGEYYGEDILEFGRDYLMICCRVNIQNTIKLDFTGTSVEPKANINAPIAVTHSAVYFFFRTLLGRDIPINSTFYKHFEIITPEGSIVNAPKNSPVVGGNVETSQRIVDVLLNAFSGVIDVPAQAQGTMNNISFGNSRYTFYETVGGGAGAGQGYNGEDGVHVYMTNTKNTPVEVIEAEYPLLCLGYSLRPDSGGKGQWIGGKGIIKHYRILEPCTFSIISDRREIAPKGIHGGLDGVTGENIIIQNKQKRSIEGKATIKMDVDDEVLVLTPGGGGYGKLRFNNK